MDWSALLLFSALMAGAQMSPGPDMVLLTRTSLKSGKRAGLAMAFGIACGLVLHALAVLTGASLALQAETWLWQGLLYAAAGYLTWLGIGLIRSAIKASGTDPGLETEGGSVLSPSIAWRRGFFCNILNGKAAVAIAVMTVPFTKVGQGLAWKCLLFCVLTVQAWLLWSLWVYLLQTAAVRRIYFRNARWLDLVFGLALVALAIYLLF